MNRRRTNLVMLVFCLSVSISVSAATPATSLYVSTHGSDSNPGTKEKPFLTVQHAADMAKPGDTVNIRGGKYCERLAVTSSGNAIQGFITFRSEPGETAMLDGSCLTPEVGDSPMVALRNVSYVKIEHLEIGNYRTADPTRVPAGIRVYGHGSHIEIRDNNVHNIEQTYPGREGPGHGANGFGIAVYGTDAASPITDLIVDGNEVHNLQTGSSESLGVEWQRNQFSSDSKSSS